MDHKTSYRSVWILVCAIGCCYQLTVLTSNYMSYRISSAVRFTFEEKIDLPSVTWCVNMFYVVDWNNPLIRKDCHVILDLDCSNMSTSDLERESKRMSIQRMRRLSGRLLRLYDGYDLSHNMLPIESLISYVMHAISNTTAAKIAVMGTLADFFAVTQYVNRYCMYYTMTWKSEPKSAYAVSLNKCMFDPGLLWFIVPTPEFVERVLVYSYAYSDGRKTDLNTIFAQTKALTTSSYETYRSKLLEAPFETECFDYNDARLGHQANCSDSCLSEQSLSKFGKKSYGLSLQPHEKGIKLLTLQDMADRVQAHEEITDHCIRKCSKQDCVQKVYSSKTTSSDDVTAALTSGHVSFAPSTPTVVTECSAKISLTEYIAVPASCLGFWFGVSVMDWLLAAPRLVRALRRRWCRSRRERKCVTRQRSHPSHQLRIDPLFASRFRVPPTKIGDFN